MPLPDARWSAATIAALADAAPGECVGRITAALHEIGLAAVDPDGPTSCLRVEHGGRRLAFAAAGPPPPEHVLALAAAAVRLALAREADHQEHQRVRERLGMLSAAAFEGILVHVDGVVIDVNERLGEIMRCRPEELLGPRTLRDCVAPEDLPNVLRRMANRVEGSYVITGIRKDGTRFPAELLTRQGRMGDRPVRVTAVRDVSDREHTLALLHEGETSLRQLAESVFDATVVTQQGIVLDVRGDTERLFGLSAAEITGNPVMKLVAPESREYVADILARSATGTFRISLKHRSGEVVPAEVVSVSSTREGALARLAGIRDLRPTLREEAERQRLRRTLEQTERLESLGVLAGGIAHDFNNLLVGVVGNADLLRLRLRDSPERDAAEAILSAGQRAASLTRQMLAYAGRRSIGVREPLHVGELLMEIRELISASLSKKANLEVHVAPASVVLGERATLTQVLMNLLTNASDALGDVPGEITVNVTHVAEPDARWATALGAKVGPGDWIQIEVNDTGAGMDEATVARIFEPFFTTKPRGHGLGLAACLGIVTSHGGAIKVNSTPGEGTRFSVLLPAGSPGVGPAAPPPRVEPPPRARTVLVVDDEELVRGQLRRMLERYGYSIIEATDGASGLAAVARLSPDVVVLDFTMPDLDGAEVVRRLRASGSRVPVVLSSGYADPAEETGLDPSSVQAFLPKPYTLDEAVAAVGRALAAAERKGR